MTTPTPRYLKSPFNGELWPVPAGESDEFVQELLKRGFTEAKGEVVAADEVDDDGNRRASDLKLPRRKH